MCVAYNGLNVNQTDISLTIVTRLITILQPNVNHNFTPLKLIRIEEISNNKSFESNLESSEY
jgi:hypothetical protein